MRGVIYTQGQSRLSVNYETCENPLKFSQVVADVTNHTCETLGVTEPTTASGRGREAEEGKVTSGQEGLQPVAVRVDNFSGAEGRANRNAPRLWLLSSKKVTYTHSPIGFHK